MAIAENKLLANYQKQTAHCIEAAILASMFPVVKEGADGEKYILFTNGKNSVFISNKSLNTLKYCTNLQNACRAAGVKADISSYARGMEKEDAMLNKVKGALTRPYLEKQQKEDTVFDMYLNEKKIEKETEMISSEADILEGVSGRLAYVKWVRGKLKEIGREAGIDSNIFIAVDEELLADIKHIESVQERKMLSQFEAEAGRE